MISVTCARCGEELTVPGGLLFSPPTWPFLMVDKYHLCVPCWQKVRAFIRTAPDDVVFGRSMAKMRRERDRRIVPPERDPRFGDATDEVYAIADRGTLNVVSGTTTLRWLPGTPLWLKVWAWIQDHWNIFWFGGSCNVPGPVCEEFCGTDRHTYCVRCGWERDAHVPVFDAAATAAAALYRWSPSRTARAALCTTCEGRGWVEGIDHDFACYDRGECVGCGGVPVQIECPDCKVETVSAYN